MTESILNAIARNDIAAALSLISSNGAGRQSVQLLVEAASHGRVEIMAALLDAGVDIDGKNECNNNACRVAIENSQLPALQLLVSRGANLASGTPDDSLLAASLAQKSNDQFSITLLDAGAPIDELGNVELLELASFSASVVRRLVAQNVDFNAMRRNDGRTPCHLAVSKAPLANAGASRALLEALIVDAGVDVEIEDEYGFNALHVAAMTVSERSLRTLLELGADVDRRSLNNNGTALHIVATAAQDPAECVILLLAVDANVDLVDNKGELACHRAARSPHTHAALCALLAAGANFDQPSVSGVTPRQRAIGSNCPLPTDADIDAARRLIAKARVDLVRSRALQVCIALQSFNLAALQLCEILLHSCGRFAPLIPFHIWWKIVTTVKHFPQR